MHSTHNPENLFYTAVPFDPYATIKSNLNTIQEARQMSTGGHMSTSRGKSTGGLTSTSGLATY